MLLFAGFSVAAAPPRRVLIVQSFGGAAPPFTTHAIAFETELTQQLGEPVDLDEISLDMARYADPDMQEALVDYISKRLAKWHPDVVVPIGSPAGIFVAQNRDRLFPETPIVYCGLDRRRLPAEALQKDAAFVGENFNLPGFVEDILQLAPQTTNIVMVIGATPLEQYWQAAFRHEFEPFTNRVSFTWLNELSFDQMLERMRHLPPRSFVFLVLLLRDASGVSHNADDALKRIHAAANAPVNSIFQNQLGLGIVGGRLYPAEQEGIESARIAIRILHGEAASNFPPQIIGPVAPQYDWRELRHWGISEARLPPGSIVQFREPTLWERYQWRIIALITLLLAEAVLIFILLANLIERRRAEQSLVESENRFRNAADVAPVMIWMTGPDKLCTFVNKPWLEFTGRTLEQEKGNGWSEGVHPDDFQRCLKTYIDAFEGRLPFFMEYRLRRRDGEYRWICDTGRPRLDNQGNFAGYIGSCLDISEARRKSEALLESENRLRAILDTAVDGIITINDNGVIESVNAATEKIFGYAAAEMIGQNVSLLIPSSFRDEHNQYSFNFQNVDSSSGMGTDREVSGRRKDGSVFPMDLAVSRIELPDRRRLFTGFVRDITERKQAEHTAREFGGRLLHAQEMERARLARELHDDITQRMARLAIDVGRVESGRDGAGRCETMREVREGLVRLSEDVHALSYRLHPSTLGDLGLADALRAECERFARQASIPTEVKLVDLPATIPPDAALGLFRITQESLRNIDRHARSHTAAVSLRSLDGGLQLAVTDTGTGFNPGQQRHRPSLGLESMRERVRLLGGELDVESAPGHGTTILAWVPLTKG
jgi:PAS domain S-box-containing protein